MNAVHAPLLLPFSLLPLKGAMNGILATAHYVCCFRSLRDQSDATMQPLTGGDKYAYAARCGSLKSYHYKRIILDMLHVVACCMLTKDSLIEHSINEPFKDCLSVLL
jgi:hypothetical protein